MTDEELIKQAWNTPYWRWYMIDETLASSEEVREKLRMIKKHLYHMEESY